MKGVSLDKKIEILYREKILPLYEGYPYISLIGESTDRIAFYFKLLEKVRLIRPSARLVDLGSGLSYFPVLGALFGMEVYAVDDFGGGGGVNAKMKEPSDRVVERFKQMGVSIVKQDLLSEPLPFEGESVDLITTFHSIEHWHHSPQKLFKEIRRILKPNGVLIIGCPNSVNLRKRIWVLFGKTNLCSLEEWYYEGEPFRGHVREPTVGELKKLLQWNSFRPVAVIGRNFIGRRSLTLEKAPPTAHRIYMFLLRIFEPLLRLNPSLCSDIHVVGRKVGGAKS